MRKHLSATSAKLVARKSLSFAFLLLCACQAGPAVSQSSPGSGFPVVINQGTGAGLTVSRLPHRIVSLSPTATEMLFAIGAGPQVVAVDDQSNYPASAPMTKLSGYQPNVEAIAGYSPDLVVTDSDPGGLAQGLAAVNVPTLIEPPAKDLNDSYAQINQLGLATGHSADAVALIARMRSDIAAIVAGAAKPARPLSVYHELDDTYYSATSRTFIGQLYSLFGLQNIADRANGAAPDYPQLSSEFIVSASPDLIVLADVKCCHQSFGTIRARPGWSSIAAVESGEVVAMDDDIASRWGPRVVDFLRIIAGRVFELGHLTASPAAS